MHRMATRIIRAQGGGTSGGGGGGFDPTTSDPTGMWLASYANPWTPTASAGTSGANGNLTGTNTSAGAAVNGYTPVNLNGTSAFLSLATANVTDLVTTTAATYIILAQTSAAVAAAAAFYDDPGLMMPSSGNAGLVFTSSGVRMGTYDTAPRQTVSIAQATGAWFMAAGRIDAGNVKCRVSCGGVTADATPVAIPGAPSALGSDLFVGKNYVGAKWVAGQALAIVTYNYAVTDTVLDNWKSYFNTTFALSL